MLRMHKRPGDYFFNLTDVMWSTFQCRHRHDPAVCRCRKPIYHVGQDEAIFKQNALPAFYWSIKGRSHLRPKSEGQGVMVSALFDEFRGFGMMFRGKTLNKNNAALDQSQMAEKRCTSNSILLRNCGEHSLIET